MHGRKRVSKKDQPSPKELAKKAAKLAAYKKLASVVMGKMSKPDLSAKMLVLTEKMAIANPDFYSIWGYRRDIIGNIFCVQTFSHTFTYFSEVPIFMAESAARGLEDVMINNT